MKTSKTTKPESREEIRANYQPSVDSKNDLMLTLSSLLFTWCKENATQSR